MLLPETHGYRRRVLRFLPQLLHRRYLNRWSQLEDPVLDLIGILIGNVPYFDLDLFRLTSIGNLIDILELVAILQALKNHKDLNLFLKLVN